MMEACLEGSRVQISVTAEDQSCLKLFFYFFFGMIAGNPPYSFCCEGGTGRLATSPWMTVPELTITSHRVLTLKKPYWWKRWLPLRKENDGGQLRYRPGFRSRRM